MISGILAFNGKSPVVARTSFETERSKKNSAYAKSQQENHNRVTCCSDTAILEKQIQKLQTVSSLVYFDRRRTNVQQLTCKIDLSNSFYYLFFSFVLIELKPFVLKGDSWGKNSEKVPKSVKKCEKS